MTEARQAREGVTFCIPNWNHRNFLPRSIGSAAAAARELKRVGAGAEIIVIDDGSRDGSQRLLLSMALADCEGLLDVVIAPRNQGLSAARNLGLRHAQYRHICYVDADNQLIPENMPAFLQAAQDTGAAMVFGNLLKHEGDEVVGLLSNDFIHANCLQSNYVDALALFDAAKLSLCGGYNERLTSHEDWEMLLHLLAEDEDAIFVPLCMGYYHVVPHSMGKTEIFDHTRMSRMFDQRKSGFSGLRSRAKMYHPALGWLINDDVAGPHRGGGPE